MRSWVIAVLLRAMCAAQLLLACTQTAGKLERASRTAAPAAESTPPAASTTPATSRPSPQSRAELDAAFALAVRETRATYLKARAVILRQPAARAYLGERLARAADERERFVASALIGWLDERKAFEEARAWLTDPSRRKSSNALGYLEANAFGERIAEEAGADAAVPLLEIWVKTFEYEPTRSRPLVMDETYEEEALAQALHVLGDPRGYTPLLAALRDRNESETRRREALYMLYGVRDPRVDDVLANVLQDENEVLLQRALAADALLERKPPQARALMEKMLLDPRTPLPLQQEVALCLLQLADLAAVPALERALERARDPRLIEDLCHALDRLGDRKTLPVLWAAASRLRMGKARTQCTTAIESIRAHLKWPTQEQRVVPR